MFVDTHTDNNVSSRLILAGKRPRLDDEDLGPKRKVLKRSAPSTAQRQGWSQETLRFTPSRKPKSY